MSSTRTYKFVVMPVVQIVDDDDVVTGEASPQQPDTVFGLDGLREYADEFEHKLALMGAPLNGAQPTTAGG